MSASRLIHALWPDDRTVWRWHFFAGLFCLPFVAFLAMTGSIYLFKPQVDGWIDRRIDARPPVTAPASPARIAAAAVASEPGSHLLAYELPSTPGAVARVIVERGDTAIRVYADPGSLAILKHVDEDWRFERIIFRLHGELLLGNVGSTIMEMVASWTVVLVVTGLYLWWPRTAEGRPRSLAGVLYPRLRTGGRPRLRDLHAVSGMWVSMLLVFFLASGLPWSFVWGHAFQTVQQRLATVTSVPGWEIGAVPARNVIAGSAAGPHAMAMSNAMPGMDMPQATPATAPTAGLDAVVKTALTLGLPAPVLVTPPAATGGAWHVRSDTQNRPHRAAAMVASDGTVLSREGFATKPLTDRLIGYGVAMHEGHLFGWANQLLNLLFALILLTMSLAACLMWLRRRPPGHIGAPARLPSARVGAGAVALMVLFGVLLPELGAALLVLWVVSLRPARS